MMLEDKRSNSAQISDFVFSSDKEASKDSSFAQSAPQADFSSPSDGDDCVDVDEYEDEDDSTVDLLFLVLLPLYSCARRTNSGLGFGPAVVGGLP